MYPRTIRNHNIFVDGVSFFGRIVESKLPTLQLQTEEFRGAGMDAPIAIDMGMQAMTAEITVAEWVPDLLTLFGTRRRVVARPGAQSETDDSVDTLIATIDGRWTVVDRNVLKPGTMSPVKLTCAVMYYREEYNGVEIHEIDVENGKRVIGGVDQLEGIRQAMGI